MVKRLIGLWIGVGAEVVIYEPKPICTARTMQMYSQNGRQIFPLNIWLLEICLKCFRMIEVNFRGLIFRFWVVSNFDILGVYNVLLAAWCFDVCSSLNLQSLQPHSLPTKRDNCSQGNVSSITKGNKLLLYLHRHCYTPRCNYAL